MGGLTVRKRGYENRKQTETLTISGLKTVINRPRSALTTFICLDLKLDTHLINFVLQYFCNSPTLPAGQITLT